MATGGHSVQRQAAQEAENPKAEALTERAMLLRVRQGALTILGAIEEYLQMPRSVIPKHRRK